MASERAARILRTVQMAEVLDALGYAYAVTADHTKQIHCPVHDDHSPSARYYHEQQKIYCFTCGQGWDVLSLVRAIHGGSFEAAMDWIEDQFPTQETAPTSPRRLRAKLREPVPANLSMLFNSTEQRLIARRRVLGLAVYSKRLLALDLTRYRYDHGSVAAAEAVELCTKILG